MLLIGGAVAVVSSPVLPGDAGITGWVQGVALGPFINVIDATNWLGGDRQTVAAAVVAVALAVVSWRAGLLVALAIPAGQVENLVKELAHRPRPSASLAQIREADAGYSYPSGHAAFYSLFAVLLLVAVWPRLPRWAKPPAVAVAVLVILVAGFGRIWVGAHWPTDVAGGILFGIVWSWLAWIVWARATRRAASATRQGAR